MTLEEQIKANTQRMAELKQQMETAISDKGGVVTPSGDSPTFEEVIAGVDTIETGIEINGAQDIKAIALSNLKKGDVCAIFAPKKENNTGLELLASFTTTIVGTPFIIEDGKMILDITSKYYPYEVYTRNKNGEYTYVSNLWWKTDASKIYDAYTRGLSSVQSGGGMELIQISEDYSTFKSLGTTVLNNLRSGTKQYFGHARNYFTSKGSSGTYTDILIYKYDEVAGTTTQVSSMLKNTGLSVQNMFLADVWISGSELWTACVHNTSSILLQKFTLVDGVYTSDGRYKDYANAGITSSSYGVPNTYRSPIKFNKSGNYIFKYDTTNAKVTILRFNRQTLEMTNEVVVLENVGGMATSGDNLVILKKTLDEGEAESRKLVWYNFNEAKEALELVCYPIEDLDSNITTLPLVNNLGTTYDSFWFRGLNNLAYNKFGKPEQEVIEATAQNCYNFTQDDTDTTAVSGYGIAKDDVATGLIGEFSKILTTTPVDRNDLKDQTVVIESQAEDLTELQTLVDEKLV